MRAASRVIVHDVPAAAAISMTADRHVLTKLRPKARDAIPGGTQERPSTHVPVLKASTSRRQGAAIRRRARVQIHTSERCPVSILATPSIPGRNCGPSSVSRASIRKEFRPSSATVTGVILLRIIGNGVPGHSCKRDDAALLDRNVADVTFVNVNDQAIGIERRNFEQGFPSFHRRAEHLAEIAGNDDSVEGRDECEPARVFLPQERVAIRPGEFENLK